VKTKIKILIILLLYTGTATSWGPIVYDNAAERICDRYDCACKDPVKNAVMIPENTFRDSPSHHCYNITPKYDQYIVDEWKTPVSNDCPAGERMDIWLSEAKEQYGCNMWRSIGIALHYYLDSKEFWNTVILTNKSCVRDYDTSIDEYIKYGGQEWETCNCGICTTREDYEGLLQEFIEKIKDIIQARHYDEPRVLVLANSIDEENAKSIETYLRLNNIQVDWTNAQGFRKKKIDELIVILGGHNSPEGIGPIVGSILTEEEAASIINNRISGKTFSKLNVWASNQKIIIYSGYDMNQTRQTVLENLEEIKHEAETMTITKTPECTKPSDCGTEYYGIPVCSMGVSTRMLYKPVCKNRKCTIKVVKASTERCAYNELCITGLGCTRKKSLTQREAVYRPNYTIKISPQSMVRFTNSNASADIIIGNYGEFRTLECQQSTTGESWDDTIDISINTTGKYNVSVTGWPSPKTVTYNYQIRCGNITSNFRNITFETTTGFTVTWVARPMQFVVEVEPQSILMDSCNDLKFVNITVKNLGVKNITCNYSTDYFSETGITILNPGNTVNWTDTYKYSQVTLVNVTNYSTYFNVNFTSSQWLNWTNITNSITWDVPHWANKSVGVYTGDCSITEYPIKVTCRDSDNLIGSKYGTIYLKYRDYT